MPIFIPLPSLEISALAQCVVWRFIVYSDRVRFHAHIAIVPDSCSSSSVPAIVFFALLPLRCSSLWSLRRPRCVGSRFQTIRRMRHYTSRSSSGLTMSSAKISLEVVKTKPLARRDGFISGHCGRLLNLTCRISPPGTRRFRCYPRSQPSRFLSS